MDDIEKALDQAETYEAFAHIPPADDPGAVAGETKLEAVIRRMNMKAPWEWLDEPELPLEWVVEDLILKGGLTMLAAPPKAGKSVFARQVSVDTSAGQPFLGKEVMPGLVLYYALEENERWVRKAFRKLGLTKEMPLYLRFFKAQPQFLDDLYQYVQYKKPVLVVIDTASRMPRRRNFEMGDYFASSEWLEPLMDIAHELDVAVLALYHNVKSKPSVSGYESIAAIMGSGAIGATIDQNIYISVDKDESRSYGTVGRFGSSPPVLLGYDEESETLSVLGEKEEVIANRVRKAVLEAVEKTPGISLDGIKEAVTARAADTGKMTKSLVESGEMFRSEKKPYKHWIPDSQPKDGIGNRNENEGEKTEVKAANPTPQDGVIVSFDLDAEVEEVIQG